MCFINIKLFKYLTLLIIITLFLPINVNSDQKAISAFVKYQNSACRLNIDLFVDDIRKNEINTKEELTFHFLEELLLQDLRMLRNTIFAKHGFKFNNKELKEYFSKKTWYVPKDNTIVLTPNEKQGVEIIRKIEKSGYLRFEDFYSLFSPITLPYSSKVDYPSRPNYVPKVLLRKYFKKDNYCYNQPFYAIGNLYQNNEFVLLIYEISSFETTMGIATFSLNGEIISNKSILNIGGDIQQSSNGKIYIDDTLTIHVQIIKTMDGIESMKNIYYSINSNGHIIEKTI